MVYCRPVQGRRRPCYSRPTTWKRQMALSDRVGIISDGRMLAMDTEAPQRS